MHEQLSQIDRDLEALRAAESLIYYRADVGDALDEDGLKSICARRHALFADPANVALAAHLAKTSDEPLERRMAHLLSLEMLGARLDEAPEILKLRHELEAAQYASKDTRLTADGMRSYLHAIEKCARERIRTANALARREGFENYAVAKLAYQEYSLPAVVRTLDEVTATCRSEAVAAIAGLDAPRLSVNELERAVKQSLSFTDEQFPADGMAAVVERTLAAFDVNLSELPIKIEYQSLPYAGAVWVLDIGRDIRIVMNNRKGGFGLCCTLFHELGHALYYVYAPDHVLLLEGREGREGLAEMWSGIVERPEWLDRIMGIRGSDAETILEETRRVSAYMTMMFVRETLFELALYDDPEVEFVPLWNALTRKCFGFDDTTGVYSDFVFLWPLDIKDYIYIDLIRSALLRRLASRFGRELLQPAVFQCLIDDYYRPGNLSPWHERLL
jgi:hypothetical protein